MSMTNLQAYVAFIAVAPVVIVFNKQMKHSLDYKIMCIAHFLFNIP